MAEATQHITSTDEGYAKALLELALEQNQLDAIHEEVLQLLELRKAHPELQTLLGSRIIGEKDRARIIESLFQGRITPTLYKFLQILNVKDRLHGWAAIGAAFNRMVEEQKGIRSLTAYVPSKLDPAESERLAKALGERLKLTVRLEEKVDPALIGGIKVRVGDYVVDGSVQAQLRILKNQMIEAGRLKAAQLSGKA